MREVYALRDDPELRRMQEASLQEGPIGLRQTHGLVGSTAWWQQIESGLLPLRTAAGRVTRFWPGHHGDWPEIEIQDMGGEASRWGCQLAASEAERLFAVGRWVEIDHVAQELKEPLNGSCAFRLTVAIRLDA